MRIVKIEINFPSKNTLRDDSIFPVQLSPIAYFFLFALVWNLVFAYMQNNTSWQQGYPILPTLSSQNTVRTVSLFSKKLQAGLFPSLLSQAH